MPELLLEVGCEELPATFVRKAYGDLHDRVAATLAETYGASFEGAAFGTPRRLIVSFTNVPERQADSTKDVRGPALKAAYDADGKSTPALLGFCRSNGVEVSDLRRDDQYVWVTKAIAGRPTVELLAEALPKAIKAITFEKSMRWGAGRLRFARPLRWILASYGGAVIPFEIEGVEAGLHSRGHRFYAPQPFSCSGLAELLEGLRARKVEPDGARRAAAIREQAVAVAGGTPQLPDDLVDENTFLCEWPTAVAGEFRAEHLALPPSVLTTAMAKHEKMFPVCGEDGKLLNRFVFVRNSGEDASVRAGAEWVLNARLDDAQFFFKEDAKYDLDHFLEKTGGIVFQERLGTVRERASRLEVLAGVFATATGADANEVRWAKLAAKYAKADLSTGLVSDMASLQGIVGAEYARRQGLPDPVCRAIAVHYDHTKSLNPACEGARTALRVTLADNLDKLVGYLGLGLIPTGSSDPFGLRRAATALIEIALNWRCAFDFGAKLLKQAADPYRERGLDLDVEAIEERLKELFVGRYIALLPDARYDLMEAATHRSDAGLLIPQIVPTRLSTLERLARDASFVQTATRPLNILAAADKKGESYAGPGTFYREEDLNSEEGRKLHAVNRHTAEVVATAILDDDADSAASAVASLQAPINAFMDKAMVMDPDPEVRFARLSLLGSVACTLGWVGDFTKVVLDG